MARPLADQDQRVAAYRMWKLRIGPAKIHRELKVYVGDGQYGDDADVVSLRTVKNWLREFRTLDAKLDDAFEWHRLEEYGLPWEAGEYLLKMSRYIQDFFVGLFRRFHSSQPTPKFRPTVRQARWWWRIHLAVSDEKADYLYVYRWAEEYVRQEVYKDVLGRDMDTSAEDAFLTYRAAFGPDFEVRYREAVDDGRIPALPQQQSQLTLHEQLSETGNAVSSTHSNLAASGGEHSYLEGSMPMPPEFRDAHNQQISKEGQS